MTQNKPIRIALTGRMRSGKSTIADYLWLNHDFAKVSFGNPIRRIADDYFSHLYEEFTEVCEFTGLETKKERKPRALLQNIGQLLRQIDEDVWIKQVENTVRFYENSRDTKGIVIDDLRQPNEYEWAKDNGFIIVRVEASEELRLRRAKQAGDSFSEEDLAHDTEQHVDGFGVDYVITNNGDLDDLKRQVDEILGEIKETNRRA